MCFAVRLSPYTLIEAFKKQYTISNYLINAQLLGVLIGNLSPRFMIKTIKLQLTIGQAQELINNLKKIADNIEGKAVGEIRPLTSQEDLLISALSWLKIDIDTALQSFQPHEIDKEIADYNRGYRIHLNRLKRDN